MLESSLPLTKLTKKGQVFEWSEKEESAFEEMKRKMCEGPVLQHYDPRAQTILQTDALFFGWGFIISQISVKNGQEHPIIIESGRFKGANQLYHDRKRFFSNRQRVFKKSTYTASCRNSGPYGPFQPSRLADCSTTVAETSKVGGIAEWFLE